MKFIATTSDKINSIAIKSGQVIFSRDDKVIYLDSDRRDAYNTIIVTPTDEFRLNIASPVKGFYFVEDTSVLFRYNGNDWEQLTTPPQENLVFLKREDFPVTGKEKTLYIDEKNIYQWNKETNEYIAISGGGDSSLVWGELN